jgi:hypothetical protein
MRVLVLDVTSPAAAGRYAVVPGIKGRLKAQQSCTNKRDGLKQALHRCCCCPNLTVPCNQAGLSTAVIKAARTCEYVSHVYAPRLPFTSRLRQPSAGTCTQRREPHASQQARRGSLSTADANEASSKQPPPECCSGIFNHECSHNCRGALVHKTQDWGPCCSCCSCRRSES